MIVKHREGRTPHIGRQAILRGIAAWGASVGLGALGCDAQVDPSYEGEPLMTISGRVEAPLSVGHVEVGILWLRPANAPVDAAVQCSIELSSEAPSACVAACGVPTCDDLVALEEWEACAGQCEGPTGVSNIVVNTNANRLFSGAVGQTTPVEGMFPAQFRLDLLEPPPEDVLTSSSTGERLAFGMFVALDPAGSPFELDLDDLPSFPPWLLGGSETHVLLYSTDGVPRSSQWGTLLELELQPGFQLMALEPFEEVSAVGEEEAGTDFRPVPNSDATIIELTVADPTTIDWPL